MKTCMEYEVEVPGQEVGQRKLGGREIVQIDSQARKLNEEDAVDCISWRKQIKDD